MKSCALKFFILILIVCRAGAQVPVATSWAFPLPAHSDPYSESASSCKVTTSVALAFNCINPGRGYHTGIDIPSPAGTSVLAAADGIVRYARNYGWCAGCWPGDPDEGEGGWGGLV